MQQQKTQTLREREEEQQRDGDTYVQHEEEVAHRSQGGRDAKREQCQRTRCNGEVQQHKDWKADSSLVSAEVTTAWIKLIPGKAGLSVEEGVRVRKRR